MPSSSKAAGPDGLYVPPSLEMIPAERLCPNTWNPNEMDSEMMKKERASIRTFGFIDPLTVRDIRAGDMFEIIDGEQRWMAGKAEGVDIFPCIVLKVDDDEARELTIILNDTRGEMQDEPLARLVQDLAKRREAARMENLLPYNRARMEQLLERRQIDWSELEKRREDLQQKNDQEQDEEPWTERVYRMPVGAAGVIDQAIERVMDAEDIGQKWRALEMIAAEFLAQ